VRGCARVSPGCEHCYAERQAHRFSGFGQPYEGLTVLGKHGPRWTGTARFVPEMLDAPLRWSKPRRVFVNSMSDLFHEDITNGQILRVFDVMRDARQHTFQILTKRPARMLEWFRRWSDLTGEINDAKLVGGPEEQRKAHPSPRGQMFAEYLETLGEAPPHGCAWPTFDWMQGMRWWPTEMRLPNVHLGVSCEDQQRADERIPLLLECPAAVRFVSLEPLLGPIDFTIRGSRVEGWDEDWKYDTLRGRERASPRDDDEPNSARLSWAIIGSESGPGARPMRIEWARSIVQQCRDAGVPVFTKQIANAVDRKGGNPEHWPPGDWPREFPEPRS
jgi:protein gp37